MRRRIGQAVALSGVAALIAGLAAGMQPLIGLGAVALFGGLVASRLDGAAGDDKGAPATMPDDATGGGGGGHEGNGGGGSQ